MTIFTYSWDTEEGEHLHAGVEDTGGEQYIDRSQCGAQAKDAGRVDRKQVVMVEVL